VPTANVSPGLWLEVRLATAQLSEAVGSTQVTDALQLPASLVWVMLAGVPEMTGSSSSVTVMLKLAVVVLPAASLAM